MNVVLLKPPKFLQVWAGVPDVFNDPAAHIYPPMGIMQLSAYLKAKTDHDVTLVDAVPFLWSYEETTQRVLEHKPDVVGLTITSHSIRCAATMARQLKAASPGITIVLGGSHVSAFPELALAVEAFDFAIQGDGEMPMEQLLDRLERKEEPTDIKGIIWRKDGNVVDNGPAEPYEDLDALPLPDRENLPTERYYTPSNAYRVASTIMGSRGCPNRCVFCNVPHRFRARSPEHIVDEMEECKERYGIQEIHFIDDIFNITTKRVIEISEEILRRGVKMRWGFKASCKQVSPEMLEIAKRAGCFRIHYGVETHSQEGLEALNKGITIERIHEVFRMTREAGLVAIAYMMVGCPHEKTPEEVQRIIPFIRKLNPDYVVYSLFTPYPDTEIFKEGARRGLWDADVWEKFICDPKPGTKLPTMWTEHMDADTLLTLFKRTNRAFYFSPKVLIRTLLNLRSPAHLARVIRGGISVLKLQLLSTSSRRI
ncbi:MAG: radical SAM protein [Verrucomicrobia bacterium]|jgi:anaerobic magnesium-protoporphyrin IX monomethyl ester cyclase|nr:radical SAM protein [Verrucomicrobiota bacterium]